MKKKININMIIGAIKSKKTPVHLKKALMTKYKVELKKLGVI